MELNTEQTTGGKSEFTPMPAGTYEARVSRIVELGSQKAKAPYHLTADGKPRRPQTKLSFTFELPYEVVDINGETVPRLAFKIMSASLHEKSHLSKIVASAGISGKFNINKLLGTAVSLSITNTEKGGKTYANVDAISPVSARVAQTLPEAAKDMELFTFEEPSLEIFQSLPEFQRNMIQEALNFKGSKVEKMLFDAVEFEDDEVSDMDSEGIF